MNSNRRKKDYRRRRLDKTESIIKYLLTIILGLIGYLYTTDRQETRTLFVKISTDIEEIKINQTEIISRQLEMDKLMDKLNKR